jgi:lysozyme family protein
MFEYQNDPNYMRFVNKVLRVEGGYGAHPSDKGNYVNGRLIGTKLGISAPVLQAYLKRPITAEDMKALNKETALDIYYNNYYKPSGADRIQDPRLALIQFDASVNHGVGKAGQLLKESGGDYNKYLALRNNYYDQIVQKDPSQKVFRQGWANRVKNIDKYAQELAKEVPKPNIAVDKINQTADIAKDLSNTPKTVNKQPPIENNNQSLPQLDLDSFKQVIELLKQQQSAGLEQDKMAQQKNLELQKQQLEQSRQQRLTELKKQQEALEKQKRETFVASVNNIGKPQDTQNVFEPFVIKQAQSQPLELPSENAFLAENPKLGIQKRFADT